MEKNERCSGSDSGQTQKFRSQIFSKTSRKKHFQSLVLQRQLRSLAEKKEKDDFVLHLKPSCGRSNSVSVEGQQLQEITHSTSGTQSETYELTPKKSRSEYKLKPFHQEVSSKYNANESEYCIINMKILQEMIEMSCICKVCKKGFILVGSKGKFGVVDKLNFECSNTAQWAIWPIWSPFAHIHYCTSKS